MMNQSGLENNGKLFQSQLASDYCWIHGSGYIPRKYQPHMKCITNLDGVEYADEGESPDMVPANRC